MPDMDALPGFVDLQVNGFVGVDFASSELKAEDLRRACREVRKRGTAAFLATLVTSPVEVIQRNLSLIASVMREEEFHGRLLGIHLEGPFISREPGAVGAHDSRWAIPPDIGMFDRFQEWAGGNIRMVTIAAEAPEADQLARYAVSHGVCVSLGHHLAGPEDIERLVDAGATALTHLGNGVPNMLHRHNNPIWAGLANDGLSCMMITDGHHLPTALIKCFLRVKGARRCVVVSDVAHPAGLPPGIYQFQGCTVVLEESGKLHNPQRNCLAGSASTMLACMNHLASLDLLKFEDLWKVGFANPLKLIGLRGRDVDGEPLLRYDADERRFELLQSTR